MVASHENPPRRLAPWIGSPLLLLGLGVAALGRGELSWCGRTWLTVVLLLGVALVLRLQRPGVRRAMVTAPFVLLVTLLSARLLPGDEPDGIRLATLDEAGHLGSARVVDRLFEERDAALVGSRVLALLGVIRAPEFPALPALLAPAYEGWEADGPVRGTPVASTLLGLNSTHASSTVVVESTSPEPRVGVVFLHGFGGNFWLQCTEVARPLRSRAVTLCPSVGLAGAWWTKEGEATVRAALTHLASRGLQRVVVMGLSNGGAGAALLAGRLGRSLDGVVLLSGLSSAAPVPRVPTLVIQGDADGMMSTGAVRRWVKSHASPRLEYLELDGTHFVLLEQREAVGRALEGFVARIDPLAQRRPETAPDMELVSAAPCALESAPGSTPQGMTALGNGAMPHTSEFNGECVSR